jgi:hypothetical protein
MNTESRFLRTILTLDAVTCGVMGAGLLALNSRLDAWLGVPAALTIGTGVFLLAFAAALWTLATRARISPVAVWLVILGNLGWVVASVVVAFGDLFALTGLGVAFIVAQAAAVVVIADLEYVGLRKARPLAA